ncbi:Energy-coupling factor transporter transmembrane protein EcfT [uncultured archaeon]|nr:Energy-coupling factor transporter transmembrane protein EcfT [uncultured archaeon]
MSDELSPHIPDLDLITFYSEKGTSLFSRISPWTKALMLVLIVLFVSLDKSLILAVCLYLIVLSLYGLSGLPLKKLFQWYTMPIIFVLSLVVILMWNEPGNPIFSLSMPYVSLILTDNGLLLLLTLLFKSLASVTFSLFFLMTTRYNYLSAMIYRVFPSPIDQIFLMSYRFIFITLKMVKSMIKALKSRGGGLLQSIRKQSKMFSEVFALTIIRSYDRADRVNKAMEARGFTGKYVAATRIPVIGTYEYFTMLLATVLMIYSIWFVKLPF